MITIEDVANKAGVSVATVSRVINNSRIVSEDKVARVNAAIEELGYKPSVFRRKTTQDQRPMILVASTVVIEEILHGIKDAARAYNVEVMLNYMADEKDANELQRSLSKGIFDGIILLNYFYEPQGFNFLCQRYPILECGHCLNIHNGSVVTIDDEQAGYDLTTHLIHKGRRRILFAEVRPGLSFSSLRKQGYARALYEHGIDYDPSLIVPGGHSYESGVEAAKRILGLKNRADAILCAYDMMAAGCISTLKAEGLRVPEDIAVTGFDNADISEMVDPTITTIGQPFYEMGFQALRTLHDVINGDIPNNRYTIIQYTLLRRNST